jgi:hypothetical protein
MPKRWHLLSRLTPIYPSGTLHRDLPLDCSPFQAEISQDPIVITWLLSLDVFEDVCSFVHEFSEWFSVMNIARVFREMLV